MNWSWTDGLVYFQMDAGEMFPINFEFESEFELELELKL